MAKVEYVYGARIVRCSARLTADDMWEGYTTIVEPDGRERSTPAQMPEVYDEEAQAMQAVLRWAKERYPPALLPGDWTSVGTGGIQR